MEAITCKIQDYSARYRQLLLPIASGISQSGEYRSVVLQGNPAAGSGAPFNREEVVRYECDTPAGSAEVLLVSDREDFVHMYRALAYKCEPEAIPPPSER